jgi:putative ABC transport system permease protein
VIDRRHVPFSPGATDKLAAVEGVHAIQRFRMLDQQIGEVGFRLVATETQPFLERAERDGKGWELIEGEPIARGDLLGARNVLLSQNAASRLRKHAGDTLSLSMGDGRVDFRVRAIVVDYSSEQGSAFIDRSHLLEISNDEVVDGVAVYAEPGASLDQITEGIRAALSAETQGALFVTQTEGVEAQIVSSLHETFAYSTSSELLTLIIALMGVVGTMAAAVVDRRREIGMLRAVGATSGQVTRAMLIEAGFLGLCAVTAGIALGTLQCVIFLKTLLAAHTGWHLDMVFPWQGALRTAAIVIVTSAVAGALPALRTARSPDTLRPGVTE